MARVETLMQGCFDVLIYVKGEIEMLKPLLGTRGNKSRCTTFMVLAAGLVLSLMLSGTALAHTDPPGSSSTGITLSLTAFRNDGTTPVFTSGGTVNQCETIMYQATLAWAGGTNAAFGRGTWTITTPDGVVHDVTPEPDLDCVGGTFDDPNSVANDGRGLCDGAPASVTSALVSYTVSAGDLVDGFAEADSDLTGAFAHLGVNDTSGVGAFTPLNLPVEFCDDGLFCNGVEACDPEATNGAILGQCVAGTPPACDGGDQCNAEVCDEEADACVFEPANEGDACTPDGDDDLCVPDICVAGECVQDTANETTCDDPGFCANAACNPDTGLCEETADNEGEVCNDPDQGDLCVADICVEGVCTQDVGDSTVVCTDPDCEECNPNTGACVPIDPAPAICVDEEICRTPGFWSTHGGTEKPNSQNITQELIDAAGGLNVCGTIIDNTDVGNSMSALEAMCVSVKGVTQRQLVRQLTAAALNCEIGECSTDTENLIADCNATCDDGTGSLSEQECIDQLDCFNNGGTWDGSMCLTGVGACEDSGADCHDGLPCAGIDEICIPFETCHDRDLCPDLTDDGEINGSDFCFEPPGSAGSTGACKAARTNETFVP